MSLPSREKAIRFSDTMYGSIGSIYITGAGFVNREFKGVSPNSSFGEEELVWKKTPQRGGNFAFTNMDQIPVGLVARCEIDVSFMTPDDYHDMKKILKQRRFQVTYFDMDEQEWKTRNMYCTEKSKSKFLLLNQSILGTVDVKLKFVGTNLDLHTIINSQGEEESVLDTFNIKYMEKNQNNEYEEVTSKTKQIALGGQYVVEDVSETAQEGYFFKYWEAKENNVVKGCYGIGQSVTIWSDLTLYPKWEQAENNS